ncbi:putative reverse transcriptase domain-containing protein [Tanacetum coccineum]
MGLINKNSFSTIEAKLCSAPILALPEGSEDFIAYCDASKKGLGAVLMQREKICEIRYHPGKANVVADALSRKEREPLRVRALVMTIGLDLPKQILNAQTEARKLENIKKGDLEYVSSEFKRSGENSNKKVGTEYGWNIILMAGVGYMLWRFTTVIMHDYPASIKVCTLWKALYGVKMSPHVCWAEVVQVQLTGPELVQETTRESFKSSKKDASRSQIDKRASRLKLNPRNVGPFKVLEKVGAIPYKLELPQELSRSRLKSVDREVKQLRQSRVPIVKVRWNSRRVPEFTWERERSFRKKYPHHFTKTGGHHRPVPWSKAIRTGSFNGETITPRKLRSLYTLYDKIPSRVFQLSPDGHFARNVSTKGDQRGSVQRAKTTLGSKETR